MSSTQSMINLSLSPASSDGSPPAGTEPIPNAWAKASATMTRWREIYDAVRAQALSFHIAEDVANDNAQVEAWLDMLARERCLRVTRTTADGGCIARHMVEILDEDSVMECGGYVYMGELRRGAYGGVGWLKEREDCGDGWVRIAVMITADMFPDHDMFKRADGSCINLGFNDNDHFYEFKVEIHQDDLIDEY